ncbi:hypothetical protein FA15DRAFT_41503 [Coprinopsis marcescibilis]|uniref:Uncharacterized protein n=1 Tax=Coprinopsis marcescibilis TaxID=230819 RepID=A0A5C3L902_COPMA|nr:hypothetical protein FA15DRAFT_41503 [Coprinopsis marcescibilis]
MSIVAVSLPASWAVAERTTAGNHGRTPNPVASRSLKLVTPVAEETSETGFFTSEYRVMPNSKLFQCPRFLFTAERVLLLLEC